MILKHLSRSLKRQSLNHCHWQKVPIKGHSIQSQFETRLNEFITTNIFTNNYEISYCIFLFLVFASCWTHQAWPEMVTKVMERLKTIDSGLFIIISKSLGSRHSNILQE